MVTCKMRLQNCFANALGFVMQCATSTGKLCKLGCKPWQETLRDPIWQVTLRSSAMSFLLKSVHSTQFF